MICLGWGKPCYLTVFLNDNGEREKSILLCLVRQEIVLMVMGGVFVMETLSVIIQVASFKMRGKRVFRMAPIHHHFQANGWPQYKVTMRFWLFTAITGIIGIYLGIL